MVMPAEALLTAEELQALDMPGKSTELVRGRLIVREPPATYHGKVAAKLLFRLGEHVYPRNLGELFGQDTGFKIAADPDTVRAPDVAFLAADRATAIKARGYAPLAPDLVAEILSPDDRPGEVLGKVADWLDSGVRIVWVIDPMRREGRVYRQDGSLGTIGADGVIEGEDMLPGFVCPLASILS